MHLKRKVFFSVLTAILWSSPVAAYAANSLPNINVAVSDTETIATERIINIALDHLGYQIATTSYALNSMAVETNSGGMELLALQYAGLEEEYPNLICVPEACGTIEFRAYIRDDHKAAINSWESLEGLKLVGYKENNYIAEHAGEYAAELAVANNYADLWDALIRNEADAAVMQFSGDGEITLPEGIAQAGIVEKKDGFMYLNKKYAELVPALAQEIRNLKADGTIEDIRSGNLNDNKDVLIYISSYHGNMKWEEGISRGILEGLGTDQDYEIFQYNLDARRTENFYAKKDSIRRDIRALLIEKQADIVIVSDNDALDFVKENYHQFFEGLPVVFCGINGYTPEMLQGFAANFAGCSESISVRATVEEMLGMYPDTEKIFILNDYTNAGRIWQKDIESQLKNLSLKVDIEYNENMTKQEILEKLSNMEEHTLVLLGTFVTDRDGVFYDESIVIQDLSEILDVPIFVLMDSYMGTGALGGFVSMSINQGITAGNIARELLNGKQIGDIPSIYASEALNNWVFDEEALSRFSLDKRTLPEGTILLNRKVPVWETWLNNTQMILVIFLVLVLMILAMGFGLYRLAAVNKKQRERELQKAKQPLEANQELLKRAEKIIDDVTEKAPFAFFIVTEGIVLRMNEFARREMAVELGQNISELYKTNGIYERNTKILERQGLLSGDITYLKMKNGEQHKFSVNYSWITYGGQKKVVVYAQDIEEIEIQRSNLKRSQKDLKIILDALPTAMGIIDSNENRLEYANDAFMDIFGYTETEQSDRLDLALIIERFYACWQGTTVVFEYENDLHLKIYADQIIFLGKHCIVLIAQDITAEVKQTQYLAEAANKEREANALKGTFLANMSHEIRTPMNAIIGLSQLALMKEQSLENFDFFSKICSSAKNLLSIINDILDFSKIEAEKMDFVEDVFNLEETIVNAFLVATDRVDDKPVEILLDMHPDVPYYLMGDKTRLWQVLKNILDNSVKYTNEGRIILRVSLKSEDEERVILTFHIQDTGVGMTDEQTEKLFAPFEQFHRSTKKAGTGLGMSITKRLIDMMSGEIRIESTLGEGSDFYVTIPFKRANNQKTMQDFMRETVGNQYGNIGSILLVDDDEYSLAFMSTILKNVNISSVMAQNTEQALDLVRISVENNAPFAVMIIDYRLGEENGIELAKKINALSENTKLLLVTAYAKRLLSDALLEEVGFRDIIEKPYVVSTFLQKVCNVFPETRAVLKMHNNRFPNARILLCEDNEINQMVVSGILSNFDIEPIIARDGAEALSILEKNKVDLILMDIMMPIMDGHEATRAIRQSSKPYKDVPIFAMTANVMSDEVEKCLAEGMNGHLEKPIDIEKFQNVLEEYLSKA